MVQDAHELMLRPFLDEFIQEISKFYEIVLISTAVSEYVDFIANEIDKNHRILHRVSYKQTVDGT